MQSNVFSVMRTGPSTYRLSKGKVYKLIYQEGRRYITADDGIQMQLQLQGSYWTAHEYKVTDEGKRISIHDESDWSKNTISNKKLKEITMGGTDKVNDCTNEYTQTLNNNDFVMKTTVTINGTNINNMSEDIIFNYILLLESKISKLTMLKSKSKMIIAATDRHNKHIEDLFGILESREK